MLSTKLSIVNELRSETNDSNVYCEVVGGLTTFSFNLFILDDLAQEVFILNTANNSNIINNYSSMFGL